MNVVLVVGPGGYAFDRQLVQKAADALNQRGAGVFIVGDGEHPVSADSINSSISEAHGNGLPITLFVLAHGDIKNGKHVLDTDGHFGLTSEELFESVANIVNGAPTDIFMSSCYAGAAIAARNILPVGSSIAALSPSSEEMSISDVERLVENIRAGATPNSNFSARHLLDVYLGKSLKNRIAPILAVSGGEIHDLPLLFGAKLGNAFSQEEREGAHRVLDGIIGWEKVDEIISKIEHAKSEWSIYAIDYGPALAVSLAATERQRSGPPLTSAEKFCRVFGDSAEQLPHRPSDNTLEQQDKGKQGR